MKKNWGSILSSDLIINAIRKLRKIKERKTELLKSVLNIPKLQCWRG